MSLKRMGLVGAVAAAVAASAVGQCRGEIPKKVNYQGRLADVAGMALDGEHTVVFRIFDLEAGGTELWTETQSIEADSSGVFSAILGSVDSIDAGFDGARWLEVEVDGEVLAPRREMVSVPFAFQAANAHMVAGLHADAFADSAHSHHSLDALDGEPATALFVDDEGSVGVGTETPGAKLDVAGTARVTGFTMATGAAAGQVLTSDGVGTGTWQAPQAASDGDWIVSNGDMYSAVPGDVGIGTSDPGGSLHVRRDQNGQTCITIENRDPGSTSGERLSFSDENGSRAGIATRDEDDSVFPNGMVIFNNRTGGGIGFQTGGGMEMARLVGGKVGIRALSPQAYLHVRGEAAPAFTVPPATHVLIEDEYGPGLNFVSSNIGTQSILFGDPDDTDIGSIKYNHSDNTLTLRTGAADRVRIAGDGRVAIGTSIVPEMMLCVNQNSNGTGATSIYGSSSSPTAQGAIGVMGIVSTANVTFENAGVYGSASAAEGSAAGVVGRAYGATGTGVRADAATATFDYKVVGKWRGYENVRFERAPESVEVMQVSSTLNE